MVGLIAAVTLACGKVAPSPGPPEPIATGVDGSTIDAPPELEAAFAVGTGELSRPFVAALPDGGAWVAGGVVDGGLVVKRLDRTGAVSLLRTWPAWSVMVNDVAADTSSGVVVAGQVYDAPLGPGGARIRNGAFVLRLNEKGEPLFVRTFGAYAWARATTVTPDGSIVLSGVFKQQPIDFGAHTHLPRGPRENGFLAVLDPTGTERWSHTFRCELYADVGSVGADATGEISALAGIGCPIDLATGEETSDGAMPGTKLLRYSPDGRLLWSRNVDTHYGRTLLAVEPSGVVAVGADDSLILDDWPEPLSAGPSLALFEKSGATRWARSFGEGGYQVIAGVGLDGAGTISVFGEFQGTLPLDKVPLVARASDLFLVSFAPTGEVVRAASFPGIAQALNLSVSRAGPRFFAAQVSWGSMRIGAKEVSLGGVVAKLD